MYNKITDVRVYGLEIDKCAKSSVFIKCLSYGVISYHISVHWSDVSLKENDCILTSYFSCLLFLLCFCIVNIIASAFRRIQLIDGT